LAFSALLVTLLPKEDDLLGEWQAAVRWIYLNPVFAVEGSEVKMIDGQGALNDRVATEFQPPKLSNSNDNRTHGRFNDASATVDAARMVA
jgi:hypothetical protein